MSNYPDNLTRLPGEGERKPDDAARELALDIKAMQAAREEFQREVFKLARKLFDGPGYRFMADVPPICRLDGSLRPNLTDRSLHWAQFAAQCADEAVGDALQSGWEG